MASSFSTTISNIGTNFKATLKKPKQRWWIITLVLLVLAVGGWLIYSRVTQSTQQAAQPVLQTTTARRGSLTLSASGQGTLQPANQIQLGFGISGQLLKLNVKVGDQVKTGDVLAELDNTSQQIQYEQARRALADLTSQANIALAQQSIATAETNLTTARDNLSLMISPAVLTWEERLAAAQAALIAAQTEAKTTPSPNADQKVKDAELNVKLAQANLKTAQGDYFSYLKAAFSETTTNQRTGVVSVVYYIDPITGKKYTNILAPTQAQIDTGRAAYKVAQTILQEAQWYYNALTGGDVPDNATGTNLSNLLQAKINLQIAQTSLNGVRIAAPIDGIITTVSAQLGNQMTTAPIITIMDTHTLYVHTYIDETDFAMFKLGNSADVIFNALPNQTFTGKVVEVDPSLVTNSGSSAVSGLIQLDPTSTNLLMGMTANVNIIGGQAQNAVLIPVSALHEYTPGKYAVFVMRNGKLAVAFVEVGLQDPVNAEIISGLQPGDIVSTGLVGTKTQ